MANDPHGYTARQFYLTDLQAAEPEFLTASESAHFEYDYKDEMGLDRVIVRADSREALVEYVRENWGDEDSEWFAAHVVARIIDTQEEPTRTPREVLVHLNVEVNGEADDRTADQIARAILGALEVGSDHETMSGLIVVVALAEEAS